MPALTHVFRRGAMCTWRRRLPSCIRARDRAGLPSQPNILWIARAKSIGAVWTAESDRVFWAVQQSGLTSAIAKAFLERVVREAQAQFARLHLASLDDGGVAEWEENRRFDLAAGHAFRLLSFRGRSASLTVAERRNLTEAELSADDMDRVEHLLELYIRAYWSESRMARISRRRMRSTCFLFTS